MGHLTSGPDLETTYVGPRPFRPNEQSIFFGREREARDLLSLVPAHAAILLYSPSGAGKTSLLNTCLVANHVPTTGPAIENLEVLPVVRVCSVLPQGVLEQNVANVYAFNSIVTLARGSRPEDFRGSTLSDFLGTENRIRVLIFDQFEEMFTTYPLRSSDRGEFFQQVGEALDKDPFLRVLFSMREEYLARMDTFGYLLPGELEVRYGLERLDRRSAREAIVKPAKVSGYEFDEAASEDLVKRLSRIKATGIEGQTMEAESDEVEPVLLQVVCSRVWEHRDRDRKHIGMRDVQLFGDVNQVLISFYDDAIRGVVEHMGDAGYSGRLRTFCAANLITPFHTRGIVFRGLSTTSGINNKAVEELERRRIVRAEERGGAKWYELTHDLLIEPILESNARQQWTNDGPGVFVRTKLDVWRAATAKLLRQHRKLHHLLHEPADLIIERIIDTADDTLLDERNTAFLFACKVLDNTFHFVASVAPECYNYLEGIWLHDVKEFMAYLLWERRGDGFDLHPERHFRDVCNQLEKNLKDEDHKCSVRDFEPVRKYIESAYLLDGPGRRELISRKAYRLWENTKGTSDGNWEKASNFVAGFYDHIIPAVVEQDSKATDTVVRTLRSENDENLGYLINNCFEAAIAIYFVHPKMANQAQEETAKSSNETVAIAKRRSASVG